MCSVAENNVRICIALRDLKNVCPNIVTTASLYPVLLRSHFSGVSDGLLIFISEKLEGGEFPGSLGSELTKSSLLMEGMIFVVTCQL